MKLSDVYKSSTVASQYTTVASNKIPYFGTGLFPAKKKMGLDLKWIQGNKGLPITLAPSTFDAKAKFRDRIGVAKVETEMPFFREGFYIKESDEQEIMRVQDSTDPYAKEILDRIFDDSNNLIDGANVVPERMIWQLLAPTTGNPGIAIVANGANYTYNYDPDNSFKTNNYLELTATTDKWSDTVNADPLDDLKTAQAAVETLTGTKPTVAIMSQATMNYLVYNAKIKSGILAQNSTATIFMTEKRIKAFILDELDLKIVVYTKKFKNESGVATSFYPDGMVTLIPEDGPLGSTWYGTTPEERSLMGNPESDVSIVNTGVAINVATSKVAPIQTETTASEIVLPSFERMSECYVIKVV